MQWLNASLAMLLNKNLSRWAIGRLDINMLDHEHCSQVEYDIFYWQQRSILPGPASPNPESSLVVVVSWACHSMTRFRISASLRPEWRRGVYAMTNGRISSTGEPDYQSRTQLNW